MTPEKFISTWTENDLTERSGAQPFIEDLCTLLKLDKPRSSDDFCYEKGAIKDSGKFNKILLIAFDAEPIFLDLIPKGVIIGSGMQQPYLMGQESVKAMNKHFNNKMVEKNLQLPILIVSTENIAEKLAVINKNVLGIEPK